MGSVNAPPKNTDKKNGRKPISLYPLSTVSAYSNIMHTLHTPVRLINFDTLWSAEVLIEILEDRNIPFVLKRYADRAYGRLWEIQQGWGTLWVEAEDAEGVLYLYRQLLDSLPLGPESKLAPTHDTSPDEGQDIEKRSQNL